MENLSNVLRRELGAQSVKTIGGGGGGCISQGQGYQVDAAKVFVKMNDKKGSRLMFEGEAASLEAIVATNTVRVPKPIKVLDKPPQGAYLIMDYLEMRSLSRYSAELGTQVARLHMANEEVGRRQSKSESSVHKTDSSEYVPKFGFPIQTCCGFIPQDNTWEEDWVTFYIRHKLQQQLDLVEKDYGDREARDLWSQLQLVIPKFFENIEIKPALLHGDLWGGNVAETDSEPVIFDPASLYGHHEFDLGIGAMFGGFTPAFFSAYHKIIPKQPGFSQRNQLYQLFHYLNHWNHFGSGYRGQSIGIMRRLLKA